MDNVDVFLVFIVMAILVCLSAQGKIKYGRVTVVIVLQDMLNILLINHAYL